MAFTAPTSEDLKERYPEFDSFDDDFVEARIGDALRSVDDSWIEDDRAEAVLALVAHWLSQAETTGVAGVTAGTLSSTVTEKRVGPLAIRYQVNNRTGGIELASTSYGVRYDQLRRRSHPPVLAV